MTDKASVEKSRYLKALGADVVITPVSAKPGTPITTYPLLVESPPRLQTRFIQISIRTLLIRKHTIEQLVQRFGDRRTARLLTLSLAWVRAEQFQAPVAF